MSIPFSPVIPAEAGIQPAHTANPCKNWIPAFAGMTMEEGVKSPVGLRMMPKLAPMRLRGMTGNGLREKAILPQKKDV